MADFTPEVDFLVEQLDAAVEAHLDWTQRVLRCAVLRASPGDDVLSPQAHTLCRFGSWLRENKEYLQTLNGEAAARIEIVHHAMHDAIRSLCEDVLAGNPGRSDCLEAFEQTQSELVGLLAQFKTQVLASVARLDPLTGLPLRYNLEHDFELLLEICQRNKTRLYAVMIDVDHMKALNERYGHAIGDLALSYFADLLRSQVRSSEQLYRYGGEEFLVLLEAQSHEEVTVPAQRFIQSVRDMRLPIPGHEPLRLSVTLGIARVRKGEVLESVVERVDEALYEGKAQGRDRYVMAED
ncbi:MAG: diguanylate cyclase [Porticoccaceae bacterium]|nr:diguanylate cyclase [Porticoccaceae bacterium]